MFRSERSLRGGDPEQRRSQDRRTGRCCFRLVGGAAPLCTRCTWRRSGVPWVTLLCAPRTARSAGLREGASEGHPPHDHVALLPRRALRARDGVAGHRLQPAFLRLPAWLVLNRTRCASGSPRGVVSRSATRQQSASWRSERDSLCLSPVGLVSARNVDRTRQTERTDLPERTALPAECADVAARASRLLNNEERPRHGAGGVR
jgi:hypothetical protein